MKPTVRKEGGGEGLGRDEEGSLDEWIEGEEGEDGSEVVCVVCLLLFLSPIFIPFGAVGSEEDVMEKGGESGGMEGVIREGGGGASSATSFVILPSFSVSKNRLENNRIVEKEAVTYQ